VSRPSDAQPKRGPGRPRTRPDGAKKRQLWLTDDEFAAASAAASRAGEAGVSAEEWMRRVVLAAAGRSRR
jgi:hypothetical protein